MAIDALAARLIERLWQGGAWGYTWSPESRECAWIPVGRSLVVPRGARNVYFGVHPTGECKRRDERATDGDPVVVNCLFIDVDASAFGGDKRRAFTHVLGLTPPPSVVVDSGDGCQAYWLLAEPFPLADEASRERARAAQAAWAAGARICGDAEDGADARIREGARTGADTGGLASVLRLPGTFNYDPGCGPNPRKVTIRLADWRRVYTFEELEAVAETAAPHPENREVGGGPDRGAVGLGLQGFKGEQDGQDRQDK